MVQHTPFFTRNLIEENVTQVIINIENDGDCFFIEHQLFDGSDEIYKFIMEVYRNDVPGAPLERVILASFKDYGVTRKSVEGNLAKGLTNAKIVLLETHAEALY